MFTTLTIAPETFDPSACVPFRFGSSGAAEQYLRAWLAGIDTFALLDTSAADRKALGSAVAKIVGLDRDKAKTVTQVAVTENGKTKYRDVRKGENVGKRETREVVRFAYSADALNLGLTMLRDDHGVTFAAYSAMSSSTSGNTVYALQRVAHVSPTA